MLQEIQDSLEKLGQQGFVQQAREIGDSFVDIAEREFEALVTLIEQQSPEEYQSWLLCSALDEKGIYFQGGKLTGDKYALFAAIEIYLTPIEVSDNG